MSCWAWSVWAEIEKKGKVEARALVGLGHMTCNPCETVLVNAFGRNSFEFESTILGSSSCKQDELIGVWISPVRWSDSQNLWFRFKRSERGFEN